MFKRRLSQKTDYAQRLNLLRSKTTRLVIRKSLNYVKVQFINSVNGQDSVALEMNSKLIKKFGWKLHTANVPASYLCGLLAGINALKNNIKEAVVDIGLNNSIKGNVLFSAAKGVKDAGVKISIGENILPSKDRITGKHIADYASLLKKNDKEYKKQFSSYLKNGINPEDAVKHFEEVKNNIQVKK